MLKNFRSYKFFHIVLVFCIALQLFQTLVAQRSLLIKKYDAVYWKDRVEHSQWMLPLSQRTIGDDGLFAYVGYTLAHGSDPSLLNPETGPVGKYLFGFSIVLFDNPYYVTALLGLGSTILFFLITQRLFQKKILSLFTTFLFVSDPLFASQLVSTSLDSIQLFFLLFALWSFLQSIFRQKATFFFAIISGLSLGLFSASKVPLLTPLILLLLIIAYVKYKKQKEIFFLLLGLGLGFLIPYIQYFHLGHSLKDFLKLQKYIISFYTKSGLQVHHQAIWDILFLGKFPDLVLGSLTNIHEWWIFWPVSFLFTLNTVILLFFKKKKEWLLIGLGIYSLASIFLFSLIPVYTRYLLLVIPFLYILFVYGLGIFIFTKALLQKSLFILCVIISIGYLHLFWIPSPQPVLSYFFYNISHDYFQDIYAEDIGNTQSFSSRETFRMTAQKAFEQAQIQQVSFHQTKQKYQRNMLKISGDMLYTTRNLGTFSEKKIITMQKIDNEWKIMWDWNDLLQKFQPGDSLKTAITFGKRGIVTNQQGNILAQDTQGYLVKIDPSTFNFQKENDFLRLASTFSGLKAVHIQNAYLENPYPRELIPLFTSFYPWDDGTIAALTSFKGVSVTSYPSRIYTNTLPIMVKNTLFAECCTEIYSSTSYQGVISFEKKYNKTLQAENGGSLVLLDKKNKVVRTLLSKKSKDGENITVPL